MYEKIMVPLDGSKLAECVLPHTESIAGGCQVKQVVFIRVVEPFYIPEHVYVPVVTPVDPEEVNAQNRTKAQEYLDHIACSCKLSGASARAVVLLGKTANKLIDYAAKNKIDLIIIATHGRSGVSRWVWGSIAEKILRSTCIPVFMVRAPGCIPGIR